MRAVLLNGLVCLSLLFAAAQDAGATPVSAPSGMEDAVETLDSDSLRVIAYQALATGDGVTAIRIGSLLRERDASDPSAHFILAHAYLASGRSDHAIGAARISYRLAESPVQRHEAARVAAKAAAEAGRFLDAQIWTRRSLTRDLPPALEARSAAEYGAFRDQSRVSLSFGLSVGPSSNVNGGARSDTNVIDGFPLVGQLSPLAQALSGTVAEGTLRLGYRLHRDDRSETRLLLAGQATRVRLSDDARDKAPTANDEDFASSALEIGLSHRRILTPDLAVQGIVTAGRRWYAGEQGYDYRRATLSAFWSASDRTLLSFSGFASENRDISLSGYDQTTRGWQVGVTQRVGERSTVSLSYHQSDTASENAQSRSESRGLRLGYAPGRPIGPVSLAFAASATEYLYPDYRIGFFPVPDGRRDTQRSLEMDVTFDRLDYYGFVPTLEIAARSGDSNVSRFDTETVEIGFGIKSRF